MSEVKQFRLPDVGEGLTEADIVSWHVKPGDSVTLNQVIVEIETAKAVVELPSPYEGIVTELLADEGATVDVGTPIIAVDVSGEATTDGAGQDSGSATTTPAADTTPAPDSTPAGDSAPEHVGTSAAEVTDPVIAATSTPAGAESPLQAAFEPGIHGSPAPKVERQAVLVGYGVKLGTTKRRQRKEGSARTRAGAGSAAGAAATPAVTPSPAPAVESAHGPAPAAPVSPAPSPATAAGGNGRVARPAAKPPVRKLAKDLGVDLAGVAGTGPDGTITREDVQAAVAAPAAPAVPSVAPASPAVAPGGVSAWTAAAAGPREERVAVRGVRKHTAAAVSASAFTAPHVTEFLQVDVTAMMAAVERLRELPEFAGLRVSPLLLVAKALLVAAGRHPMMNSSWDEGAQEIVVKHYVNLGIAAATERGLIVPNIKDAHALSLPGLAGALAQLTATARQGKAQPADLTGGTITITNVGVFGVDAGTPILTPGEAAILAFGQVREMPWVHEGQLAVRQVTTLSLSFDHRIVDGDLGSAFLRDLGAMLADPVTMLAWG
ncbi:MAG TPA: dihydrolipoamide acetyltransferase family protein [Streptosporangiaceae bacterium]|jgi:2-oxoisovalerate dehydrogenase E2 component (dihydrolipoyl transacylase)|nr:dihydrolipoamide acetyltransferase family protein [Streptosporangiaceae bacterium]